MAKVLDVNLLEIECEFAELIICTLEPFNRLFLFIICDFIV